MIAVLLIVAWVPQFIATFLIRASGVGGILWTSGVCDGVAGHYPCVLGLVLGLAVLHLIRFILRRLGFGGLLS